jgi:eukaryotic-like serine/threonine-protein kinase
MEILLTVLGVLGCITMMAVAMLIMPRLGRRMSRSARAQQVMARLRRQSAIDRVLSWVEDERPDIASGMSPDGTVTILFTDIENSTALNEQLGDRRWLEVLRAHNSIVRDCIREHGGYEVKSQGDGFMIAYPSARRAVECAVDMQRKLARAGDGDLEAQLRVRIGLHTGEAIREGDDFYGRSVTFAARLGDEAEGGEILASSVVRDLVSGTEPLAFEEAGEREFKGLDGSQPVYRVRWDTPGDARRKLRAVG